MIRCAKLTKNEDNIKPIWIIITKFAAPTVTPIKLRIMEFRTIVNTEKPPFLIAPFERILLVGSCFADSMAQRFAAERFDTVVNPYGVMYNPASILHTVEQTAAAPKTALFTLGTNRVYILRATDQIVDNCRKRPAALFREAELSIEACTDYLARAVELLRQREPQVKVVVTVSPIRYAKYGYHGSRLAKATLLLAAHRLVEAYPQTVAYFPAYEIMNDELRDYRFYREDMLHPTDQAVSYIWERFSDVFFSQETKNFIEAWRPLKEVLAHRPFDTTSEAHRKLMAKTAEEAKALEIRWGLPAGFLI